MHVNGLQHKGAMSTKPVFKKIAKIQRSSKVKGHPAYYVDNGHMIFVLLTPTRTMTIIDKITILCNDVNKTSTFVELLAINVLCYR